MKSDTMEKELGRLRAKEQKSGQQLGRPSPGTKNWAQLSKQQKTLESPTEANEEDERPVASQEENITPKHIPAQQKMRKNDITYWLRHQNQLRPQNSPGHR